MPLSSRWTHGLIAQSVTTSERVQCLRVLFLLRPTFSSYSIESVSGQYLMYQLNWQSKRPKWNVTLNKQWIWSGWTKLTLSASWTHCLIAQWVIVSEQGSVLVGSYPTQLRLTFYSYSIESVSGEYFMYHVIPSHSCDYPQKTLTK